MNELSSFFDKVKGFRIGSSNEHSPSSTGFLITVFIKGSGIQHILSSLGTIGRVVMISRKE